MRRLVFLVTWVAVAGAVAGFTLLHGKTHQSPRPKLERVSLAPLKIRGSGFAEGEVVRVTGDSHRARATVGGNGTFVVTIRGASRCDSFRVLARGSKGDYAVLKMLPAPACVAARTGGSSSS